MLRLSAIPQDPLIGTQARIKNQINTSEDASKEKGYVRCDYFIDDRVKYLNQQPNDVKLIKFDTPYIQDESLEPGGKWIVKAKDWEEIYNIIKEAM